MDAATQFSSPSATLPLKRSAPDDENERPLNLKGTQFLPTPSVSNSSNSPAVAFKRGTSPSGSTSTLSSIQDVSSTGVPERIATGSTAGPPAKKRKQTPTEKAEQQRQKEVIRQERAAEKARKDAEKAVEQARRDEEKVVKDEEKRRKAEIRETKKREKELAEERKNQEQLKKERSQMRLGIFFQSTAPSVEVGPGIREPSPDKLPVRRRSISLETYGSIRDQIKTTSKATTPQPKQPAVSDYRKYFLPYEPRPYTRLPIHAVIAGPEAELAQARFDSEIEAAGPERFDLGLSSQYASIRDHFPPPICRAKRNIRVRDLYAKITGTLAHPIDLTEGDSVAELSNIPMKRLHFHEDVRPAYYGTFTAISTPRRVNKLRRNPFARERTDTNYDYDSEAEWVDDEAGEDLDLDEEDDESIGDENEMGEFLDDADDEAAARRRLPVVDLVAESTGVCWENEHNKLYLSTGYPPVSAMQGLRLEFLLPGVKSIDPYSTTYWQNEAPPLEVARPPLKERSSNTNNVKSESGWPIVDKALLQSTKKGMKPGAQKSMNAEEFEEFKTAVAGSLLSKQELVNHLKTLFPNLTTVLVKDTLGEKFAQIGKSKADKKWVFVGTT